METTSTKMVNYQFMKNLFDKGFMEGRGWKSHYFREAQSCFKKQYSSVGKWKINENDPKKREGHIGEDDLWSWTNRINTHPNCCLLLHDWALKNNPNVFIDFGNPDYHEYNARRMWEFCNKYFEQIFTKNITHKYYNQLKYKCQKSWNSGIITTIAIILTLKNKPNVTDIKYSFEYGDSEDMNGTDLIFKLDGVEKTMQIKSGKYLNLRDIFLVSGSPNDLSYKEDYYGYANVDEFKQVTSVIIFENKKQIFKDSEDYININSDLVFYEKIENMPIPEKLNELLVLCGKLDIEFIIKTNESVNEVLLDENEKTLTINVFDFEDEELEIKITKKIEDLKKRF
jgi:hypothetical protein